MATLRCTRKLIKFLEIVTTETPEPPTGAMGDWYANLIPTYAGELIIFVNERSLVTVAIPARENENLIPLFRTRVENLLMMIGIPREVIDREISHLDPIQFAKTASRSVLGSMNDIAWHYQIISEEAEDKSHLSLSAAELKLSQMPSGRLGYRFPIDVAKELLLGFYGSQFPTF
jgi:hypothetical protein